MTKLTRWEPMRDLVSLRETMDRLMDQAFSRPLGVFDGWDAPQLDLYETEKDVIVEAALPGVKAGDIDVSISGDILSIRGTMSEEKEAKEATYHLRERRTGSVARSISLPSPVNADKATAEFRDGVLTLTLPKVEAAQRKSIRIKAS